MKLAPKAIALFSAATLLACSEATSPEIFTPPVFGFGNGAPTGSHYNLNIIGVPRNKTADMTGANGHVIFVKLEGGTKILLCEAGVGTECANVTDYQVLDANGTDGTASFALPDPDPDANGTTVYSVYARALGAPGGHATNTTCGYADDGAEVCSIIQLVLSRTKGKSTFENVSKYLLYVYADVDGDLVLDRVPLFSDKLINYFWQYDNNGLRLAQLRFYPCTTTVPEALDPGGSISTDCV